MVFNFAEGNFGTQICATYTLTINIYHLYSLQKLYYKYTFNLRRNYGFDGHII